MQACQALFCLKKWFLVGHSHLGTSNGHFLKWQNHLQKGFIYRSFLNQIIISCGGNAFKQSNNVIGFTKYIFKS